MVQADDRNAAIISSDHDESQHLVSNLQNDFQLESSCNALAQYCQCRMHIAADTVLAGVSTDSLRSGLGGRRTAEMFITLDEDFTSTFTSEAASQVLLRCFVNFTFWRRPT